jgi:hypothetical protein
MTNGIRHRIGRLLPLAPGRSIKRRLVLMFLLLAVLLTTVFAFGAQRAFSVGWRDAARPLLADYVVSTAWPRRSPGPPVGRPASPARRRSPSDCRSPCASTGRP